LNEVWARAVLSEFFAGSFDAEILADGAVAEAASDAVVEEIEVAVFKFYDLPAVHADEVVMSGAVAEVRVVGGLAVAEIDFVNEVGLTE